MGDIYKCILTNQNFPVPVAAPLPAVAPPALPPPPLIILPPLPVNVVPPPAFVPQFPVPVAAPLPAVAPPALPPPFILPPPPLIILPPLPVHVVPPPAFVPQQPQGPRFGGAPTFRNPFAVLQQQYDNNNDNDNMLYENLDKTVVRLRRSLPFIFKTLLQTYQNLKRISKNDQNACDTAIMGPWVKFCYKIDPH